MMETLAPSKGWLGVKQLKKDLGRNTLVLDAAQVVWLKSKKNGTSSQKDAKKMWQCFWSQWKDGNAAVAADQADRQRDVTCDNSPKESEVGDSGKDMKRRRVCASATERLVVKATGNTGTLTGYQ